MTKKLFCALAILGLTFCAGQGQQLMAQSAPARRSAELDQLPGIRRPRPFSALLRTSAGSNTESPSDGVALGLAKAKPYRFMSVDYPAASGSDVNDFNHNTAVGDFVNSEPSFAGAFYFHGTTYHSVVPPNSIGSSLAGINASGDMVGSYYDPTGLLHGFLYNGRIFTTIDVPGSGGFGTRGYGLSDSGAIVGDYYDPDFLQHGFVDNNGAFTTLDFPGAVYTYPNSVNSKGEIVGWIENPDKSLHGFLLTNGNYSFFDVPGALGTAALGINDAGEIVGGFFDGPTEHGFTYLEGTFTQVDVPGAGVGGTIWYGVANNGDLAGYVVDTLNGYHAIIAR